MLIERSPIPDSDRTGAVGMLKGRFAGGGSGCGGLFASLKTGLRSSRGVLRKVVSLTPSAVGA